MFNEYNIFTINIVYAKQQQKNNNNNNKKKFCTHSERGFGHDSKKILIEPNPLYFYFSINTFFTNVRENPI